MSTDEERWAAMLDIPPRRRRIDVWWNDGDACRLAALTAYLFTRTSEWSRAKIRIIAVAETEPDRAALGAQMRQLLEDYRIPAAVAVVPSASAVEIARTSADAALVLLPMRLRDGALLDQFGNEFSALVSRLPMTAGFVAGAPVELSAGPDTGEPGRLAAAEREAFEAGERRTALEKRLAKIASEIQELRVRAEEAPSRRVQNDLADAEKRRESTRRKIMTARAKEEAARAEVARLAGKNE
jgi:hypothetical protein